MCTGAAKRVTPDGAWGWSLGRPWIATRHGAVAQVETSMDCLTKDPRCERNTKDEENTERRHALVAPPGVVRGGAVAAVGAVLAGTALAAAHAGCEDGEHEGDQ